LTFEWDNLHLACQICNTSKGARWDEQYPILDCVKDPIKEHLSYRFGCLGPFRWHHSRRGKTTIDHAGLNRPALLEQRKRVADRVECIREIIRTTTDSATREELRSLLRRETSGRYGSLVEWQLNRDSDA